MQTNSRGSSVGAYPLPQGTVRLDKDGSRRASLRGSTSPWMVPPSSVEPQKPSDKAAAAVSLHNSVQADDYQIHTSNSSSILSGCETVAPQSRSASLERSAWRRPYGVLTGLLSRRSDNTSRKAKSSDQKEPQLQPQQQQQQSSQHDQATQLPSYSPLQVLQAHKTKPRSRAARIPLLESFEGTGTNVSAAATQIGTGSYDWPAPLLLTQKPESLHPTVNSSRHELSASPLLSTLSHSSHNGSANRVERRDKRSISRFADHGELHFVPLGSTDMANRGNSASVRRSEVEDVSKDEIPSVMGTNGRTSIARRRRTHGSSITAPAASLSNLESQGKEQLRNTRGSQMRTFSTDENELSGPSLSSNVRGVRDAKAALLRYAQGVSASVRTSRVQSFRRVPSNVGGEGRDGDGENSNNNNASGALLTQRASKVRGTSRERRSLNCSRSCVERDDGGNSLYSIGPYDDPVHTSISPGSVGSPVLGRQGVLFPATAVNQEINMSTSHVCTSRRLSRTDDGSAAILEVMDTSALTSRGNIAGGSGSNRAGSSTHTTRGRSSTSVAKSSNGHNGSNTSREDASHRSMHRRVLSGGYSFSRTGGCGDSEDGDYSVVMEERHRHKVDEVLRRLNRKSNAGNNQSTMSRAATSEVMTMLDTSHVHSTADVGNSATGGDNTNNSVSAGGGVTWSGIGGLGWGGLAGFGAGAAFASTSDDAAGGCTGGWAGLGGDSGSEDWYARMRKKAAEEEAAEASAAAAAENVSTDSNTNATTRATNTLAGEANAKLTSPGTVSITASPGSASSGSNPTSGRVAGPSTTTAITSESPMPTVARSPGSQLASVISSVRSPGTRLCLTPSVKSSNTSANTSVQHTRRITLVSSRTPLKPLPQITASEDGISHVLSTTERFMSRPLGVVGRAEQQHQQQQEPPQRNMFAPRFSDTPLEPPADHIEGTASATTLPTARSNSLTSVASSGRQSTLPGNITTNKVTASAARRGSRNSVFLTAAAPASVNVDDGHCSTTSKSTGSTTVAAAASDSTMSSTTGVILPALPSQRAETSGPMSSTSSEANTPSHRRFDNHRHTSLPRVLSATMSNNNTNNNGTSIGDGADFTSTVSTSSPPRHSAATHERISITSSTSYDTFGRGATQPASPAASVSQHARGVLLSASEVNTALSVSGATGTDSSLGARRNSSPNKYATAPFTAGACTGSTGLQHATLSSGFAPKKSEGPVKTSRVIAASTRLSIS